MDQMIICLSCRRMVPTNADRCPHCHDRLLPDGLIAAEQPTKARRTAVLSKQYGLPSINLEEFELEQHIIALVPREVAVKHDAIPVNLAGDTLIVALAD